MLVSSCCHSVQLKKNHSVEGQLQSLFSPKHVFDNTVANAGELKDDIFKLF